MGFPYSIFVNSVGTSTTAAYATGGVIGTGVNEIYPVPEGGFIQGVTINAKSTVSAQIDVMFFRSSMPNTTFTNASTVAISSIDTFNCGPVVHVTDWTFGSTAASVGTANGLAYSYSAGTGGRNHVWYALVARGALTVNSTTDISVAVTIVS